MKKIFTVLLALAVFVAKAQTTYVWTNGGGNNLFSNNVNWNPFGVPGPFDDVIFDGTSGANCSLDQAIDVNNMVINSNYIGTIDVQSPGNIIEADFTQSGGTFNANAGTFDVLGLTTISGGNFNCGSATVAVNGDFLISSGTMDGNSSNLSFNGNYTSTGGTFNGSTSSLIFNADVSITSGTFNSTSGTLLAAGNSFSNTGGSFNHNNGTFVITRGNSTTFTLSGTNTFNRLECTATGTPVTQLRGVNFTTSQTTSSLVLNGAAYPFRYQGDLTINDDLTINGTNTTNPASNTATFTFSGNNNKTINGTSLANANRINCIEVNTTGTLAMTGQITIKGRWTNTNIGGFTPGSSTVNFSGNSAQISSGNTSADRAYFDNLTVLSTSTLSILASSQVDLNGDLTNNGNISSNTSLLRLTGAAQTIGGSSTTSLNAVDVSSGGIKTVSSPLVILDSVGVSAAGTLASGGNVTLRSVAVQKAKIARIATGGSVSGAVAVQNFFPGGTTGWTNLCSPGVTGQTMANWNTAFAITCSGCPFTEVAGAPFTSIYSYDETLGAGQASASAHYIPIASLGQSIADNTGYWVYLGDGQTTTNDITAVMTGNINQGGSVSYNLTLTGGGPNSENGWNLISNPYPAPISLASMFAGQTSDVDNSILVWNPDSNGGNGDWTIHTIGGGGDVIPMGQGFMVRVLLLNNLGLTSSETWKNVSNASVERMSHQGQFNIQDIFKLNLRGGPRNFNTFTYFDFDLDYTSGFDNGRDVYFLGNTAGGTNVAQIFSTYKNERYLSAALPELAHNSSMSIPIHVPTGYTGAYEIEGMNMNYLTDYCFELEDLATNTKHDLFLGTYHANINANDGSSPRFKLNVTHCIAAPVGIEENSINGNVMVNRNAEGLYVKTNFTQNTKATICVTNVLGQKIVEDKNVNIKNDMIYLNVAEKNQLIIVTVTDESGNRYTKKIVY